MLAGVNILYSRNVSHVVYGVSVIVRNYKQQYWLTFHNDIISFSKYVDNNEFKIKFSVGKQFDFVLPIWKKKILFGSHSL